MGAGGEFQAVDLTGTERELDAPEQCRVRIGLEVGIDEVRDLAGVTVQLDQVGPVDLAQVGPGAPFVDAQQRVERFEGAAMDVEGIRQQLADRRVPAGVVDGLGIAGPKEPVAGQAAGGRVAAEEGAAIALEAEWERISGPPTEPPEGQVNRKVLGTAPRDRVPRIGSRRALHQG